MTLFRIDDFPANIELAPFTEISIDGFDLYKVIDIPHENFRDRGRFEHMFGLLNPNPGSDFDVSKLCTSSHSKNFFELYSEMLCTAGHAYFSLVITNVSSQNVFVHCLYRYSDYGFVLEEHLFGSGLSHIPGYARILVVPK